MHTITEDKAREINSAPDLNVYSRDELVACDHFVKTYALDALGEHLAKLGIARCLSDYIKLCARAHYGSVETDEMLSALRCYPQWVLDAPRP